jgi:putative SOS response-associated peptidase YedK
MCGRFVLATPIDRLAEFFEAREASDLAERFRPNWNIPPTQQVLGVTVEDAGRIMDTYHWGLIPSWAKDPSIGIRAFNARAETVATKPTFRAAFTTRRCLIPADAFYEWHKIGKTRQPYAFVRADGAPIAFAGLWEAWRSLEDEHWLRSCTIITTAAGVDMAAIHDRMPVILEPDRFERWLDPNLDDRDELEALLAPTSVGTLVRHRVDARVGSPRNNDPALLDELTEAPSD